MLAILMAMKKWNSYLVGRHFKIKTDHNSLRFLLDQKTNTPAQQLWVIKMMGYDFELIFRKGSSNQVADALSRIPTVEFHAISVFQTDLFQKIKHSWLQDAHLVHLIHKAKSQAGVHGKYTWQRDQLRRKGKLVVGSDSALRTELLQHFHTSAVGGHSGVEATMKRISSVVYWKGLKKSVKQFVCECTICQRCKYDTAAYPGLLQPLPIPERIWSDISMDFIEGLPKSNGKEVILVVVDRLIKTAHFIAMSHPYTALLVAQHFMDTVFKLHGVPSSIVSDRDKIFLSNF